MDDDTAARMMEIIFLKWKREGKITNEELIKAQGILWRMQS